MYECTRIDHPDFPLVLPRLAASPTSSSSTPSSPSSSSVEPRVAREGKRVDRLLELRDLVGEKSGAERSLLTFPLSRFGEGERTHNSCDEKLRTFCSSVSIPRAVLASASSFSGPLSRSKSLVDGRPLPLTSSHSLLTAEPLETARLTRETTHRARRAC